MSKQQEETLEFFSRAAERWKKLALSEAGVRVNVIRQRNDYVLEALGERPHLRSLLDIGCGTGDLAAAAAQRGLRAVGVDFSEKMIEHAQVLGCKGCEFLCRSIFDCSFVPGEFDAAAANGFIEYISREELHILLELLRRWLQPGGLLVLGSRNRLFSLLSLNEYTLLEAACGALGVLAEESAALCRATIASEFLAQVGNLAVPPEQDFNHPATGIAVARRNQYTPAELGGILARHGFSAFGLGPVHIHAMPPALKVSHPQLHVALSELLQIESGRSVALVPQASTFMIAAERES